MLSNPDGYFLATSNLDGNHQPERWGDCAYGLEGDFRDIKETLLKKFGTKVPTCEEAMEEVMVAQTKWITMEEKDALEIYHLGGAAWSS